MKSYDKSVKQFNTLKCAALLLVGTFMTHMASANEINMQQYGMHNMLASITNSNTSTIGSSMGFANYANTSSGDVEMLDQNVEDYISSDNSVIITAAEQSVLINDVALAKGDWIVTVGEADKHLSIGNSFGSIVLPNGGVIAALNNADMQETVMERVYSVPTGVYNVNTKLLANFVTTEYPEWKGTEFNDSVQIDVITGSGNEYKINTPFRQELNSSDLKLVEGLPAPMFKSSVEISDNVNVDGEVGNIPVNIQALGGELTPGSGNALNFGGETGFKDVHVNNIPVAGGGNITIRVTSENVGDKLFPSAILVGDSSSN